MPVPTIQWIDRKIRLIDQTQLPEKLAFLDIDNIEDLAEAMRQLKVRGAPAIGVAAALGVALAAQQFSDQDRKTFQASIQETISYLSATRPTAVNLFWALDRMQDVLTRNQESEVHLIRQILEKEALSIFEEDRHICREMGRYGAELIPDNAAVMTHCNAGGLATADYGTALGVIYSAAGSGKKLHVYATETRPLLQGSRLTAWELQESKIDVTIICDSAAGMVMRQKKIDGVIVGADRIAANGDTANKIGTYTLAVLAEKHHIPFYVVAPRSTFDLEIEDETGIPIEIRSKNEVVAGFGRQTGPENVAVYNPAFDVTPHELVTAFVTEKGVLKPPFDEAIAGMLRS